MVFFKSNLAKNLLGCIVFFNLFFNQSISAHLSKPFKDPFIENIIEVKIPGVQGAYNPSIIELENGYLMAFRYDIYKDPIGIYVDDFYQYIGVAFLDKNFKVKGSWKPCIGNRTYDPRLLKVEDTVYMIFASAAPLDKSSLISSRLNLCTINYSEENVSVSNLVALNVPFQKSWEKNWVLFHYNHEILLEYQLSPHIIVKPSLLDGSCEELIFNENNREEKIIHWPYGIIRGGTPAILVDGKYLGFFHSSQQDPSTHRYTYYIGAYTFLDRPPFTIDRISKAPFLHKNFYVTPKNAKTYSDVVFPGGFIVKKNKIYLCYGENDDAIKIMILNKKKLFASMQNTN